MTDEHVPGFEIIKAMAEKIDRGIELKTVKYNFDRMEHTFVFSKDGKKCEVPLSRDLLDDLNDYSGSKESKYWIALECTLKKQLSIPLQAAGLIPFSSSIFFEDLQEWEQDNGKNIEVYYSADDYEIFQDGLKEIYHHLEEQKKTLSHLKLTSFPYDEDQQHIHDMLLYRNKQISENSSTPFRDHISVTSRKHLKAAGLIRLLFYENELERGRYPAAVKNEIAAKIVRILSMLLSPVFEKIEIAEYLHGISKDRKPDQPKMVIPDNSQKPLYDVVISFAGEDRDSVERLVALLKCDSFKVFYDKYEEADLWGKNLYDHLTEIYSKRGIYCVMFLSRYYAAKQWPNHERKAAQARAFKENREYILPIRIDDTEIPGMLDTVAYQDLREKSIEAIYEILKKKLLSGRESAELIRMEPEVDSISRLGLSDDALNLVKLLSDRSELGRENDPSLLAKDVLAALNLPEEAVAIAADELHERGFVKLVTAVSMGKIGFRYIIATEALFASTDKYLKGWDTERDSISLAQVLVKIAKDGHGVSIQEADDNLKWGPRRLNPALFLLIERDLVNPSESIHPDYIAIHVILKPRIHRYIKG